MNDLIFWIRENRDVTVTVLFNFEANKVMIRMHYVKHPTWNYLGQMVLSNEINYIDVLDNMKEELMARLKPESLKEESHVNSIYDIYGILRDECVECAYIKENREEELYCSKRDKCDMEPDDIEEAEGIDYED